MINGPWPLARAKALAQRLSAANPNDPTTLVQNLYRSVLQRNPTEDEQRDAAEFLKSGRDTVAALVDLTHVLMNTNEFLYVD